ncbi:MAG: hypothetical protein ABIB97_04425, partial [Patescibacteria group bacterium]
KARESNPKLLDLIRSLGNLIKVQGQCISYCSHMFGWDFPTPSVVEYDQANFDLAMDRMTEAYGKRIEEIELFLADARRILTIEDLKDALSRIRDASQLRFFWRRDRAIREILDPLAGKIDPVEAAIARKVERI